MPLDPQVEALLNMMSAMPSPDLATASVAEVREAFGAAAGLEGEVRQVAKVENRSIPGPAGEIPVRIYWPEGEGPRPVLVYYHGGGWVVCSLDTHDGTCRSLCADARAIVVSVDYRMAPEAKFPAPLDDCYAATVWSHENAAALGGDPARFAIGGDSAGGNLAAAVALAARERGGPAIVHQLLVYPVTDHRFDTQSYSDNGKDYFLTTEQMQWFWNHYLRGPEDAADPLASPLRAKDLSGLPPATVITAEFDPLRDEGRAYAKRLGEAGVPTKDLLYEGVIHGFFGMTALIDQGKQAMDDACAELRAAFSGSAH